MKTDARNYLILHLENLKFCYVAKKHYAENALKNYVIHRVKHFNVRFVMKKLIEKHKYCEINLSLST